MKDSNGIRYFWLGLVVGGAAATFLAPKSGAETRRYCQTKARETGDMLTREAEDLRDLAFKTMERGKHRFENELSKFSAAVEAGRRAFKNVA